MNQISLRNETFRKLIHVTLLAAPITYYNLGKWPSVAIFAAVASVVVSLDYMRRSNLLVQNLFGKLFGFVLRPHEVDGKNFCGASWVMIAATINFLIFPAEIAVTAFGILAISDAAAALIGRNFHSQPFFEKTLFGSIAFFVTGLAVLFVCGMFYHSHFWFYFFGFFALVAVTIIEARPTLFNIDDNFLIPISFSTIMFMFNIMWNYSY